MRCARAARMSGVSEPMPAEGELAAQRHRWLVTGVAGFIGSHLLEALLKQGQAVVGLDNFATGKRANLEEVRVAVGEQAWQHFEFIEGDIVDPATCARAVRAVDLVLHQAALGSVPRSIEKPLATHAANATGFINMLVAAREAGVRRFVYAASSSTYGDSPALPKVEDVIGRPLSPYAVTKYLNELYADVFARCYGMQVIGLRYFNVFGSRQDPDGPYAAVIPRWADSMLAGSACVINGDGESSRDFTYVANAVQVNLCAALTTRAEALAQVYNVAVGERTTLNELHRLLADAIRAKRPQLHVAPPTYAGFRAGDVRHSQADIGKAQRLLGYVPSHGVHAGLNEAVDWYIKRFAPSPAPAHN
jgi:UDP-N-acetylglucosamine 4-epimerase